ncbi:MAG: PTS transporter subunit IIC [Spiroplasma sp. hy2]|uniref:PTS transporter subunit IIC n=1 Tax=Spiroplasma sp. hy2 TaxID=2490850 RepID=UPI003B4EB33B
MIGLFALVGCLLQRKKLTETISATIKTTVRFLIIGGGAGILVGAVGKLGNAFNLLFGINGVILTGVWASIALVFSLIK